MKSAEALLETQRRIEIARMTGEKEVIDYFINVAALQRRDVPKKPIYYERPQGQTDLFCPICGCREPLEVLLFPQGDRIMRVQPFCGGCGQAIDGSGYVGKPTAWNEAIGEYTFEREESE